MPLGFERLNERTQRPNGNINFIKPLASATAAEQNIAREFLERIAAQCFPVMKKHYISVMALEEYPPNPEFLGRNFNAGEVIQLVLKDRNGRWLGFHAVQMVMMHELAHCKHMNHSRDFWKERNIYADEMKELWSRNYLGEGLWGRGKNLNSGRFVHDRMPDHVDIPEHLCGGTYRRARGRKRKRGMNSNDSKPTLTYAERQQRRISRKFGRHGEGNSLGEDDLVRGALERGGRSYSKPKVAQSKRGRELRANAALARLEQAKKESREVTPEVKKEEDDSTESDWSGDDDHDEIDNTSGALPTLTDSRGRNMVRVCGEESDHNNEGRDEMNDMHMAGMYQRPNAGDTSTGDAPSSIRQQKRAYKEESAVLIAEDPETESDDDASSIPELTEAINNTTVAAVVDSNAATSEPVASPSGAPIPDDSLKLRANAVDRKTTIPQTNTSPTSCVICSLENDAASPTCVACAHVLKPGLVRGVWRCLSESCQGTAYINAGDAGRCGLCGASRPAQSIAPASDRRAAGNADRYTSSGVVSNDVLRWD